MRNVTTQIWSRTSSSSRPDTGRRREDEKQPSEPKPKPKRCLNEAAHKLGR
jgi:hypothetical protein